MGPKEPGAVFVDAISGQHVSSDPQSILQQRRLTFSKDYGWQYDVWVEDPLKYALSGANSRFSLPAIAQRIQGLVTEAASCAAKQVQQGLHSMSLRPSQGSSGASPALRQL